MARTSGGRHELSARHAAIAVFLLLSSPANGFLGGSQRVASPTADHDARSYRRSPAATATSPLASRVRCSALSVTPVTDEEEVDEVDYNSEILTVREGEAGKRLDAFLGGRMPEQSRSYFGGLCQLGMVSVGGKEAKKSAKVEEGQDVEVRFMVSPELSLEGEDIPLDIIFEDAEIIAVSKPPGMVVHPAPGSWNGTFVNALVYHLEKTTVSSSSSSSSSSGSSKGFEDAGFQPKTNEGAKNVDFRPRSDLPDGEHNPSMRPGIVHRLDKGTTGVLLAAKNPTMQAKLAQLFAERKIRKSYLTVCVGNPGKGAVIDVPIGRHPTHRQRMVAVPTIQPNVRARRAVSIVSTEAFDGKLGVAEVAIETGRTHQIRVHMQHRRTPVLGDDVYGNKDWNRRLEQSTGMTRPLLHAHSLEFTHPGTGEQLSLVAPLPADIEGVVRRIYPQVEDEHPEWLAAGDCDRAPAEETEDAAHAVPKDLRDYSIS